MTIKKKTYSIIGVLLFFVCVVGLYLFLARKAGVAPASLPASVAEPIAPSSALVKAPPLPVTEEAPRKIVKGITVAGVVVDTEDVPLEGVRFAIMAGNSILKPLLDERVFLETQSAEDGTFSLHGLRGGVPYSMSIAKAGYHFSVAEYEGTKIRELSGALPETDLLNVKVILARATSVSGMVVDKLGQPVANVQVYAAPSQNKDTESQANVRMADRRTRSDGAFEVVVGASEQGVGLWGEWYPGWNAANEVPVQYGSVEAPLLKLALAPNQQKEGVRLCLPIDPVRVIEGRVIDTEGRPVTGARVWALDEYCRYPVGFARKSTAADGRFRIEGLLAELPEKHGGASVEKILLNALCPPDYTSEVTPIVQSGERNAEIVMRRIGRGRIKCRVYDAENGNTLRNSRVRFAKSDLGDERGFFYGGKELEEGVEPSFLSGWATLDNVPAGNITLVAQAKGYGVQVKEGIVVEEGKTTETEIGLTGAGLLCVGIAGLEGCELRRDYATAFPEFINLERNDRTAYVVERAIEKGSNLLLEGPQACDTLLSDELFARHSFELAPGTYRLSLFYTLRSSNPTSEGFRPDLHFTEEMTVEVSSGETTRIVWDANTAVEQNTSELMINLGNLDYSTCSFHVIKRDVPTGGKVWVRAEKNQNAIVALPVPSGALELTVNVRPPDGNKQHTRHYKASLDVTEGDNVSLSIDDFKLVN